MSPLHSLELVLLALFIAVVLISGIARRLSLSYPIILVMTGLVSSFVPGLPRVHLSPDMVFLGFLPPLLFAAAWQTSWTEFKENIVSISMLAFGLVFFTALGVAFSAHYFLPGFDWRLGFLLGAVVSPTDAVAATSIARKIGMPRRIVQILEGESLLNDATGLLALEFGIEMIVRGTTPTVGAGLLRLVWLLAGGIVVGLLIGELVRWLENWVDDGPVEIAVSIIVPYAAYLATEEIHASGVIAVVVCGLYLSWQSARFFSPDTRLQATAVWDALEFLLNGLVFILIGLQLPYVMTGLHMFSRSQLVLYGVTFSSVLVLLRLIWMYPGAVIAHKVRSLYQRHAAPTPSPRSIFVVGWTGMRGVVALAAASSLPDTLGDGRPFEQRNLIQFLTFSVILVTLVVQGVSLAPLVRLLGLGEDNKACDDGEARRRVVQAAIDYLETGSKEAGEGNHAYEDVLHQYRHRMEEITGCEPPASADGKSAISISRLLLETMQVEREELNRLRDSGQIGDALHRQIERELDLSQTRLSLTA